MLTIICQSAAHVDLYHAANCTNVSVTVIASVLPLLLVTLSGMLVAGDASLLKPMLPGVISCTLAPVFITSVITPLPGAGSVPCVLLWSEVTAALLVYTRTQLAADVCMVSNPYAVNPLTNTCALAPLAKLAVVTDAVVMLGRLLPVGPVVPVGPVGPPLGPVGPAGPVEPSAGP